MRGRFWRVLGTSGKTGGGAFFAFLTRRPLIPWEDGSPRRPGRTLPDGTEGACHRAAGQGGGPRADGGSPARGDRAAQRAEGPTSSEAKWDGKGQRAEAARLSQGPPWPGDAARGR